MKLFLLGLILWLLIILVQTLVLDFSLKINKVKKVAYRKIFLLALVTALTLVLSRIIGQLLGIDLLTIVLVLATPLVTFHFTAKKILKTRFTKNLVVYLTFTAFTVALSIGTGFILRDFLVQPYSMNGNGMAPTLNNNEYALFKVYDRSYEQGEIIVFTQKDAIIVSRVIGVPGDKVWIKNGEVFVNESLYDSKKTSGNIELTLSEGEYFVLSDNREESLGDSRHYGPIRKEAIMGTYLTKISL